MRAGQGMGCGCNGAWGGGRARKAGAVALSGTVWLCKKNQGGTAPPHLQRRELRLQPLAPLPQRAPQLQLLCRLCRCRRRLCCQASLQAAVEGRRGGSTERG